MQWTQSKTSSVSMKSSMTSINSYWHHSSNKYDSAHSHRGNSWMFLRASDCQIASSTFFGEDNIMPGCSRTLMKARTERGHSQFLFPFNAGVLLKRSSEAALWKWLTLHWFWLFGSASPSTYVNGERRGNFKGTEIQVTRRWHTCRLNDGI